MAIDYQTLKHWPFPDVEHSYRARDTMLYALGLGLGADPMDAQQLRFVYEEGLNALPTMAVVLAHTGQWSKDPRTGINWQMLLHGEQGLVVHRPLPAAGTVVGRTVIEEIIDKGKGRGTGKGREPTKIAVSDLDFRREGQGSLRAHLSRLRRECGLPRRGPRLTRPRGAGAALAARSLRRPERRARALVPVRAPYPDGQDSASGF